MNGLKILLHNAEVKQGSESRWVVRLDKRLTRTGSDGYKPAHAVVTRWEPKVEYFWNFGESRGWISSGERPSIAHRYLDWGDYLLRVEARSEAGTIRGQISVNVTKRDLFAGGINAIQVDPATSTYEMTADVYTYGEQDLTIRWEFDDGEVLEGTDLWKVRRAFVPDSTIGAKVTWTSQGGSTTSKTFSLEAENRADWDELEEFDAQVVENGVRTRVTGSMQSMAGPAPWEAELRPFGSLFLGANSKGVCRFMMTAFDPKRLVGIQLMAVLPSLSDEGRRFRYPSSIVTAWAEPNAESYLNSYNKAGFHKIVQNLTGSLGALTESINEELDERDIGFVQYGNREAQIDGSAAVAVSPLGVEKSHGFSATGGKVDLLIVPNDRVVGIVNLNLEGGTFADREACKGNFRHGGSCQLLSLQGTLVLDLKTAPRDGIVMYDGCLKSDFAIKATHGPMDGEKHVVQAGQLITVVFTDNVDPDTLNENTFELGYLDRSGEFSRVEARLSRSAGYAFLKPVEDLLGGVRYIARVKTGVDGVRAINRARLPDADGTGWYSWDFWTRIDFVPESGGGSTSGPANDGPIAGQENLSCHVLQTVRDAPLIAGKPAVARIYANWKEHSTVQADQQVRSFDAQVLIKNGDEAIVVQNYQFVRPDLWDARNINMANAQHTANLFWTPERETPPILTAELRVNHRAGEPWWPYYRAPCSTPVWRHAPRLNVAYYMAAVNDWFGPQNESRDAMIPAINDIARQAELFSEQLFPMKSVSLTGGDVLHPRREERFDCDRLCAAELLFRDAGNTSADIVVVFMPASEQISLGGMGGKVQQVFGPCTLNPVARPGIVIMAVDSNPAYRSRWVHGLVHEIGHVLDICHVPMVQDLPATQYNAVMNALGDIRNNARNNGKIPKHWYKGIEGFLVARDGTQGWNKSSTEGNGEDTWLLPLMWPGTLNTSEVFISRHHYIHIQDSIDAGGLFPQ